jgi:hypothetical protein
LKIISVGDGWLTVKLRPVKIGTSRVGYLNHRSRNSILTPPSVSWSSEVALSFGFVGILKLRIRFAACAACAKSAAWR